MDHRVALAFEDGVTRFITCRDDQTVADASYRSRINIPLDCRDGVCGTCKALCESGEFDMGGYLEDALSDDEAESGYVLTCSMKPRSDLVLQIATTSAVAKTSAATHRGRITALDRLSSTTVALTVEIDDRDSLTFLPGQYVNIAVPGTEESRSYSFSSAPQDEELTFLVKLTPGGVMSTWLEERAEVGDEISFTGPHGSFFLRESDAPLLLLAGGTGLAPILSILRTLEGNRSDRQMHLVYGVTTDDDLVEIEAVEQLAGAIEGLTWDYCVADPATKAPNQGYVTGLYGPEQLHDGDAAVYLCGPPAMVEAVRKHVAELGVTPSGFYYEKFALAAVPTEAPEEVVEPEPEAEVPESEAVAPEPPPVSVTVPDTVAELLALDGREGRTSAGQALFPPVELPPLAAGGAEPRAESPADVWRLAGQSMGAPFPTGDVLPVDDVDDLLPAVGARAVAGQEMLPEAAMEQLTPPASEAPAGQPDAEIEPASTAEGYSITADGYEIGEEHPSVHESDAIFDARRALELGALELTIGRLTHQQLVGYRVLAEATVPYVEGDRFVDAAAYTETNAAFHDYLFTLTRNEHLLRAYQALGVKGHMEEALRSATWCHPRCAQDHLDIVEAFRDSDRERARILVTEHAERSKETTRRAMHDLAAGRRPRFVTPGRFAGQVVLVTGAGQGIGERTARRISAEGGTLVLADRAELVRDVARELGRPGAEALPVVADLETWEGAKSVVDAALQRFGRIDVAIHTVGGTIWAKPFEHYPPDQIQAEINRSLWPTMWCCRAVVPHMVQRGQGTIVNVSSVATRGLNRLPYAAAKGGVNAITTALALELAPSGVRVVATAPGGTEAPPRRTPRGPAPQTEQEQAWYRTIVDQTVDSSLLKRYGTLDEQAAALAFLASDEASYITGTILPVAGGDLG
ncbi:benzoate 1,2-dioxygenase electron transfer component BenC [Geodermatophilus sabuli]|uniref:1,2-dihydroxycyclohexa-3,5-diene-1-carboxylate dehydrogenase n=1 Tax=Geodermatophilus sabuli TaxID=1564158 RepID=A0A285E877_9ACTN|nr:benzoate 1,2-dioxygenase electron transfer component BenC [Geodermatophilus sabuli]MBB3082055.1 benzoate/toluate 1,2-dioxygenase reductase subunit [Geodermatophilus sabuli]SNX95073.1 1,2-dihydroxycyclohexa-3,5-diene-1-carboxylate dehydrogenase [Geodermatophilus sabuli]